MSTVDKSFPPDPGLPDLPHQSEISLLLALADPWLDAAGAGRLHRSIAELTAEVDWSWIFHQGAKHRVLPLIGFNLRKFRLYWSETGETEIIPDHWVYTSVFEGNRVRNAGLSGELARVLAALNASGVPYAVRKGLPLCERFFPDPGMRRTSDFDLLVAPSTVQAAGEVLAELGYSQALLQADGTLRPYDRATQAFWRLHVNNSLPYIRPTDAPGVEAFFIDLCLSVLPGRDRRVTGSVEFLERSVPAVVAGVAARVLEPADELLDLCQHLYKEADTGYYIELGRDIALSKFIDVVSAVRAAGDDVLSVFADRAVHYGVGRNAYFALFHAAQLYPGVVPDWLLDRLTPGGDAAYLDEYGHLEGNVRSWHQGFLERAFDTRRANRMEGGSSVPVH
ncbi:nucleotidyltransferase family protein [Streptomyces sp. NPDC048514]|uniref:nucleotidyltransferase family protein n=1 Tax=Streptomyces sp. NPDC048514 TaxID=3365564 RepID=UPI0037114F0A